MRNKFKIFFIFLVSFLCLCSPIHSNEIKFEAENIETIDKNLITATNNIIISDSHGNKIFANKLVVKDEKFYTISENFVFENTKDSLKLK